MDVDRKRKLALLSRDPRAYGGSTIDDPGTPNANNATNIAGVYVVDVKDPERIRLLSFQQLPTGHTTTCVNDCEWLWTGGPAATRRQQATGWTFGRPIIATDLSNPRKPRAFPTKPVDLFRRDGLTAYSHDVQVDDMGIAWVSGDGGTRGYWTEGRHFDALRRRLAPCDADRPDPVRGRRPAGVRGRGHDGRLRAQRMASGRKVRAAPAYRDGDLLLATEEDFGPANEQCQQPRPVHDRLARRAATRPRRGSRSRASRSG